MGSGGGEKAEGGGVGVGEECLMAGEDAAKAVLEKERVGGDGAGEGGGWGEL